MPSGMDRDEVPLKTITRAQSEKLGAAPTISTRSIACDWAMQIQRAPDRRAARASGRGRTAFSSFPTCNIAPLDRDRGRRKKGGGAAVRARVAGDSLRLVIW
jgi:hypothetical protein